MVTSSVGVGYRTCAVSALKASSDKLSTIIVYNFDIGQPTTSGLYLLLRSSHLTGVVVH